MNGFLIIIIIILKFRIEKILYENDYAHIYSLLTWNMSNARIIIIDVAMCFCYICYTVVEGNNIYRYLVNLSTSPAYFIWA